MLIQGDNLEALKALLPFYAGRVKCVYIDPPYNTRSAFAHYDDNLEHATWLSMMLPRLELLRDLLAEDGSIWVSIDDHEAHYLKVVMDEVFGRDNFIANFVWQKKYTRANDATFVSDNHDHIICFSKDRERSSFRGTQRDTKQNKAYKNPDNDSRGSWKSTPLHAKSGTDKNRYSYTFSNGVAWTPPVGTYHRFSPALPPRHPPPASTNAASASPIPCPPSERHAWLPRIRQSTALPPPPCRFREWHRYLPVVRSSLACRYVIRDLFAMLPLLSQTIPRREKTPLPVLNSLQKLPSIDRSVVRFLLGCVPQKIV